MKIKEGEIKRGILGKVNVCRVCNSMFMSNRSTAKICSNKCKVKEYRNNENIKILERIKAKYQI
jgi:hypothetical protein